MGLFTRKKKISDYEKFNLRPTIATPGRYGGALQRRRAMMARRNAAAQLGGEYTRPVEAEEPQLGGLANVAKGKLLNKNEKAL
jgi:hypothetical protein